MTALMEELTVEKRPANPTVRKTKPVRIPVRVHRNHVLGLLRNGKPWSGWICADKVNAWHINKGWHIGAWIEVATVAEFREYIDNYTYYNCNWELGYRVLCWE